MPWRPSISAQVRASAIWPTAAAACVSSSFSGAVRQLQHAQRPSAIAPDDTTSMSRLSLCSSAMSSHSARSQSRAVCRPAGSTSSDEPTLTTMRRKSVRGRCAGIVRALACWSLAEGESGWSSQRRERVFSAAKTLKLCYGCHGSGSCSAVGRRRFSPVGLVDHVEQRPQRLRHALARIAPTAPAASSSRPSSAALDLRLDLVLGERVGLSTARRFPACRPAPRHRLRARARTVL